jgi:hypothetical protein
MVLDRLLVVLEGIDALLTPVPLYRHATGKISDLLSRCARRQNKQTNGRGCRAKRFDISSSLGLALSFWFAA